MKLDHLFLMLTHVLDTFADDPTFPWSKISTDVLLSKSPFSGIIAQKLLCLTQFTVHF